MLVREHFATRLGWMPAPPELSHAETKEKAGCGGGGGMEEKTERLRPCQPKPNKLKTDPKIRGYIKRTKPATAGEAAPTGPNTRRLEKRRSATRSHYLT